jgi:hypothetical protein
MADQKSVKTLMEIIAEHYKELFLLSLVLLFVSVWLYEYYYSLNDDELIGLLAAVLLFFGIIFFSYSIRGWRDGDFFRNRNIKMKSRDGAELLIPKRNKKKW